MSGARRGAPNISIGGSVTGSAVAAGSSNRQQVSCNTGTSETGLTTALEALRAAMAQLNDPHAQVARANVEQAIVESKKDEPNHHTIGAALNGALDATKKVGEIGDTISKMTPWLVQIGMLLAPYGVHFGL